MSESLSDEEVAEALAQRERLRQAALKSWDIPDEARKARLARMNKGREAYWRKYRAAMAQTQTPNK